MKGRSPMLIFIAILALIQGVLGVFRAFEWFNIGADLLGKGLLILPLVGAVAFARGGLVIVLAMLHVLFAVGMLLQKSWAWWLGLIVAAISVLLVINVDHSRRVCFTRALLAYRAGGRHRLFAVCAGEAGVEEGVSGEEQVSREFPSTPDTRLLLRDSRNNGEKSR